MKNNLKVNSRKAALFGSLLNIKIMPSQKRSQLAIFIILAIILVAAIILIVILNTNLISTTPPKNIQPVYDYYKSCIESETKTGAFILGQQAGYINPPEFSPGSEFMPFSNYLNFFGTGVPYWYYISGNNIVKEQIPSKEKMQEQLNDYVGQQIQNCNFQEFEQKGFIIIFGQPKAVTKISDDKITAEVKQPLTISFENKTWTSETHKTETKTQLGKFYNSAKKIYDNNKQTMFLENYGLDILKLNAPVDDSEISCSTKIWQTNQIREDLINALQANIPFTKIKGNYYELSKAENKYFVHDIGEDINSNVNFMFSSQWPVKIDIYPSEGDILKAEPVGLQEGLGMLGFCYLPYHFVYDFSYPVLIQIYSDEEIFQFPIIVSIDKNQPRSSETAESIPDVVPELCSYKITPMTISTYNADLISIKADINFKCFDTTCSIGKAENGELTANFPQCANGYLIASSEGYETKKQLLSTITSDEATIILEKEYELNLELIKGLAPLQKNEYAVITLSKMDEFGNQGKTTTLAYPEQTKLKMTQGNYDIKIYTYSESDIKLSSSKTEKCVKVPKAGILSVFGATEEKCFTIDIPEQILSYAITGGGKTTQFITETELQSSKKITINTASFATPSSVEDIQINYNSIETSGLDVVLE